MDYYMLFFIVCVAILLFIIVGMRSSASAAAPSPKGNDASTAKNSRLQMVEDMKMMQTSRVVDQVSILDELLETTPNYRQYCELVGTAQHEGGVVAPYSRRNVAYYEIRCYRIENRGSGDVETLVAHERSFDPFYFKDGSCDTPIYVDINSFGNNVMLINSTNHIEGPNSEFARAVDGTATSSTSTASSGTSYIVGEIASGIVHGFGRARDAIIAGLMPQEALAYVGASAGFTTGTSRTSGTQGVKLSFASSSGRNGHSAGIGDFIKSGESAMRTGGSAQLHKAMKQNASSNTGRPQQPRNQQQGPVVINVGMPTGLGSFLGNGPSGGFSSVPRPMPYTPRPYQVHTYRRTGMGDVMSDMITGMVLSTVLDSMARTNSTTQQTVTTQPRNVFRGYRLVEDVVPLGSPVYCIGEIYHHGTDVYMSRSLSNEYTTSFFATKPEVEVLSALGA